MAGEGFSYKERLVIAPSAASNSFWRLQMESTVLEDVTTAYDNIYHPLTPFPQDAHEFLQRHNATNVIFQVATSAYHSYDSNALESNPPGGPSGVLVRASLHGGKAEFEALLRDLVGRRILLAPLFSVGIRRLHRHLVEMEEVQQLEESNTTTMMTRQFEIVLPMEGAALSSEGMKAFQTAFSPCRNESGIMSWNDPKTMSEFFVNRESTERHLMWMQLESTADRTKLTKGLQFFPRIDKQEKVSLADIFSASQRHRLCPFADQTTLEIVMQEGLKLEQEPVNQYTSSSPTQTMQVQVLHLDPKRWKHPIFSFQNPPTAASITKPLASIEQTIQRPRGVAYSGKFVTQLTLSPPDDRCPLTAEVQWFIPAIIQPTWQSFQVMVEDIAAQSEKVLDWRQDLNGSIITLDDTIRFIVPQFQATSPQVLTIQWDYKAAFLSFEHFPGDANRGVEIPPAVVKLQGSCIPTSPEPASPSAWLYSSSLLILPPVPDMSMPFNVISMTCSLYAFIVGSLLNLLIRKSSERVRRTYDPLLAKENNGKLAKIKARLKALLGRGDKKDGHQNNESGDANLVDMSASSGPPKEKTT